MSFDRQEPIDTSKLGPIKVDPHGCAGLSEDAFRQLGYAVSAILVTDRAYIHRRLSNGALEAIIKAVREADRL